ncbi:hypothetical protein DYB30_005360 [Aphanomyces astaci]|uniref:Uncharacterized protein n=1 Tax=Aphanomyces astaci TaxID=112090 RepID=A0A397C578_APHAT|nr:hypothetical protein DYB30_005360 [Aphanomyces astaci]
MPSTPKNIVIVSVGTRGDIQPYCVLGVALTALGHNVTIASETRLENLITSEFKLPFRPIVGDLVGGLFDESFQVRFRNSRVLEFLDLMDQWNEQYDKQLILASYVSALRGADVVIGGPLCTAQSYSVAEAMGATWVPLFLGHVHLPTTEFPQWLLEDYTGNWLGFVNTWTHSYVWSQVWKKQQVHINAWRESSLQLPRMTSEYGMLNVLQSNDNIVVYQACSVLLAGPKRRVPLDYTPGKVVFSGFLFPTTSQPEPELLKAFLSKDTSIPVIYIGFGSMPTLEPLALVQLAVDVCKIANCRCVLAAGWTSMAQSSCSELIAAHSDLVYVERGSISHTWLFPQMSCLLHHAGLGTLAAALRSGTARVPQIPCPKFVDQFHNAKILISLGVAACAVSKTQMTAAYVGAAVLKVLRNDNNIQATAKEMGEYVANESQDALARLCESILQTKPTFAKA